MAQLSIILGSQGMASSTPFSTRDKTLRSRTPRTEDWNKEARQYCSLELSVGLMKPDSRQILTILVPRPVTAEGPLHQPQSQ
jgi:hypothetical protein